MRKRIPTVRFAATLMAEADEMTQVKIPRCAIKCVSESLGIEPQLEEIASLLKKGNKERRVRFPSVEAPPALDELWRLDSSRQLRKTISALYTHDDLSLIGRLVNHVNKWSSTKLVTAFSHLVAFDVAAKVLKNSPDFKVREYNAVSSSEESDSSELTPDQALAIVANASKGFLGSKTDEHPLAYDAAMLYTACVVLRVDTSPDDTISTLARRVAYAEIAALSVIAPSVKQHVSEIDAGVEGGKCLRCTLSNKSLSDRRARVASAVISMSQAARSIASVFHTKATGALRVFAPTDDGEACALVACAFELDIIDSDCPVSEYARIIISKCRRERYIPASIGSRFCITVTSFPSVISIFEGLSSTTYAPLFTQQKFDACALVEGFTISQPHGFVQPVVSGAEMPASAPTTSLSAYASTYDALRAMETRNGTVINGWHPRAVNITTPFTLEELSDVARKGESILTFGAPLDSLVAISVTDVIASFVSTKTFVVVDAKGKTVFLSQRVLDKLRSISQKALPRPEFVELIATIDTIEKASRNLSSHSKELCNAIASSSSPEEVRSACVSAMEKLVHVGMYMRGWKVSSTKDSAYPLASIETTYPSERQGEVEVNVTLAISEYEKALEKISDESVMRLAKTAPLLFARMPVGGVGKKVLVPPINGTQQGLTVEDRLEIVKAGEQSGNIFACMRTSSNYILASAYSVLTCALDTTPPFDIEKLDDIQ